MLFDEKVSLSIFFKADILINVILIENCFTGLLLCLLRYIGIKIASTEYLKLVTSPKKKGMTKGEAFITG